MAKYIRRWYQQAAIDAFFDFFATVFDPTRNPVIAIPTGGGKSSVLGDIVHEIFLKYSGQRIMCLVDDQGLVEGNAAELLNAWSQAPVGIYCAGLRRKDLGYPITYGSCQSMRGNAHLFGHIDLLFIDEAHMVSPIETATYISIINELRKVNPLLRIIGLTATPYRMKDGMITDGPIFTDLIFDCTDTESFNKMIADGFLKMVVPHRVTTTLDTFGVKTNSTNGDFINSELEKKILADGKTYNALLEVMAGASNRNSWLIFTSGIKHANLVSEMLDYLGVSNVVVTSETKNRAECIRNFKNFKVKAMIVKDIATKGFNHPHLDCIVLLRPTNSPGLHVQMIGRGTRVTQYAQNCLLFDFAQNVANLGPINDPKIPGRKIAKGGDMPICFCDACGLQNHAKATTCVHCGAEIDKDRDGKLTNAPSDLDVIKSLEPKYEWRKIERMMCNRHKKIGNPDSLRVSFVQGLKSVDQYVALERTGFLRNQACEFWRLFTGTDISAYVPATVTEALERLSLLHCPTYIKVWTNKGRYEEIVAYSWAKDKPEL